MKAQLILGVLGSVVMLGLLFELLRRKKLREKYAAFWVLVAIGNLAVVAAPGLLYWTADLVGVDVPANLLFFVASLALMAVSIHHSHDLGRLEERTRALAEEVALLNVQVGAQQTNTSDSWEIQPRTGSGVN